MTKQNNKVELNPTQEKIVQDLREVYKIDIAPKNCRFVILGSGNHRVIILMSPQGDFMEVAIRQEGQTDLF